LSGFVDASDPEALPKLISHITEKGWREVFLHVVSMMKPADELLLLMKQQIDALVVEDETLQQLLLWVNQKSLSAEIPYKRAEVRAFYLALVAVLGKAFVRTLDPNLQLNSAKARNACPSF
jgi:predicted NACHT family NTPase